MIPDRNITRKIRAYDSELFVKWNSDKELFEVFRKSFHGPLLITRITRDLYEDAPRNEYAPLDERILFWLYSADSWRHRNKRDHVLEADSRFQEIDDRRRNQRSSNIRDSIKDLWNNKNSFYTTRYDVTKTKPFQSKASGNKWIKPDIQKKTSSRIFTRSRGNAKAYNYQPTGR